MRDEAESELVRKAVRGERSAFAALLEAYYDRIYRIAYRYCGNQADAEDLTQEVCIKLGASISTFEQRSAFASWVYRITVNQALDFKRRQKPGAGLEELAEIADTQTPDPEQTSEWRLLWQRVLGLPEKQRLSVLLVYSEGLSHAEAATAMNCAESTISWHLHEARKHLKSMMTSHD